MKLNAHYGEPIPLEGRFAGFFVRPLTTDEANDLDDEAANVDGEAFDVDVFYARKILCDGDGEAIEGTDTVEAADKLVSRGYLRDLVREAKETLQLGKAWGRGVRLLEQRLASASTEGTTPTA